MPMAHLTTVVGSFHAKVVAARLGAEGIPAQLRGGVDGPYPIFDEVRIYVRADQVDLAREVLAADASEARLGDAVDAVFEGEPEDRPAGVPRAGHGRAILAVVVALILVLVVVGYLAASAG